MCLLVLLFPKDFWPNGMFIMEHMTSRLSEGKEAAPRNGSSGADLPYILQKNLGIPMHFRNNQLCPLKSTKNADTEIKLGGNTSISNNITSRKI